MDGPTISTVSDSDLIFVPSQQRTEEQDILFTSRLTWKSRFECMEAYFCALMSFSHGLQFGASLGRYGCLIFIPYIFWNIFVGIPALLVQVMISRYVMSDTAEAWNMCPTARGVLWILFGTTTISIINNFIYLVYLMKYFFASFTDPLKWATCDASWNTVTCFIAGKKTNALSNCLKNRSENFCMSLNWETSGTQFWKYQIMDKTSMLAYVTIVVYIVGSISLVASIIYKDIRSLKKTFIIIVFFPIILGVILAWVSFSTNESISGVKQFFTVNWNWLLHPRIWVEALENTIVFLGLGDLSISFVSSHGVFTDDIFADVVLISFSGFLFNMFFMIPVLSVSAESRSRPTSDEKYHLKLFKDKEDVFISISDALVLYPFPNFLWAILTYANWFLITIGVQAILILAVCDVLTGMMEFKFSSVVIIFLIFSFIATLCSVFFSVELFIDLGSMALVMIVLFTVTWQCCYGAQKFNYDFFFMIGRPLPILIKLAWLTLLIFSLTALVFKLFFCIPDKPYKYICYIYIGIPIFIYLIGIPFEMAALKFKNKKPSQVFSANPDWGPENTLLKNSRLIIDSKTVNREFIYRQELSKKPFNKGHSFADQNIVQLI